MIFGKKTCFWIFTKGGTLWWQNRKFSFLNFLKFCISSFKNSFTGTKGILKWTKSWNLVTLVIKLWKWETAYGWPGPKWPPSVGIGLSIGWRIDNCRISLLDRWNSIDFNCLMITFRGFNDLLTHNLSRAYRNNFLQLANFVW